MADDKRRRNTRVPFHARVNISLSGRPYTDCKTRDLSLKGVFVVGVTEPVVGESGTVELCLSGTSSTLCLSIEAAVTGREEEGIALSFTGTSSTTTRTTPTPSRASLSSS